MPSPLHCHETANADLAPIYEILVGQLTDFVLFLMDPSGCIMSWNPGVEHVLGYKEAEWVGQSGEIIYTPEDRARRLLQEEMAQAQRSQCARDVRWHLRKSGERVYVEGSLVALRDASGLLLGFSKIMRDITERKRAEDALRTAEKRLRALVTASSDVLYRMNRDWTEMRQLAGSGFIADTPRPNREWLRDYIHPDDQDMVLEAIQDALESKGLFELEHRVLRVDGSVGWTHSRAVPLLDAEGEIWEWFGTASDITQRKDAEAERELYLGKLARSNEDLSQFAHVVSHDLRSPIRAIKSFSQLLSRRCEGQLDSAGQRYLYVIQQSADSMNQLIETLLRYAVVGQEGFLPEPVRLDMALETVLHSLQPALADTGAIVDRETLPIVLGDRSLLEQLLQNLIGNAVKYRKPKIAPHVRVTAQSGSDYWTICVSDNGEGIEPKFHEQIFAPLQRLHGADIEGTGIGLAVCKRIVERHGGRIWVESERDRGSKFFFTLAKSDVPEG